MTAPARYLLPALFALSLLTAGRADPPGLKPLEIGKPAPDFDLPGVDDRRYRLQDFAAAKVLAVVFTCNHCPTAQAYEDRLLKLHADYQGRGVTLVAISPNNPGGLRLDELGYTDLGDSLEDMKLRAKDRGFRRSVVARRAPKRSRDAPRRAQRAVNDARPQPPRPNLRNNNALVTTLTLLIAIAAAARTGFSSTPKRGYSAPIATGISRTL